MEKTKIKQVGGKKARDDSYSFKPLKKSKPKSSKRNKLNKTKQTVDSISNTTLSYHDEIFTTPLKWFKTTLDLKHRGDAKEKLLVLILMIGALFGKVVQVVIRGNQFGKNGFVRHLSFVYS